MRKNKEEKGEKKVDSLHLWGDDYEEKKRKKFFFLYFQECLRVNQKGEKRDC